MTYKLDAAKQQAAVEAIVEANNSLHGSHGFFLSLNGGEPDKYHLSRPIEELKARGNREWRRAEALAVTNAALLEALESIFADKPRPETYGDVPCLRCACCAYRWPKVEDERHGEKCAFVIARKALNLARGTAE